MNFPNPSTVETRSPDTIKKKCFTEEQIAFALRQAESGTPVKDVVRKMGVSEQAVVFGGDTDRVIAARQKVANNLSLIVSQSIAALAHKQTRLHQWQMEPVSLHIPATTTTLFDDTP